MSGSRKILRVRIIGVLALLVFVYALWMAFSPPIWGEADCDKPRLPMGTLLRLEFAKSRTDVTNAIGELGDDRRCLARVQILRDNIWVAMYVTLFVAVSLLLSRRSCPWAKYLGRLGIISGVAAGLFDLRENYQVLEILKRASDAVTSEVWTLRGATLSKWTLIFVTMSVLAVAFFGLSRLASWVGFLYALAAAIGLIGIGWPQILGAVQLVVLIPLLVLTIATLVRSRDFVECGC